MRFDSYNRYSRTSDKKENPFNQQPNVYVRTDKNNEKTKQKPDWFNNETSLHLHYLVGGVATCAPRERETKWSILNLHSRNDSNTNVLLLIVSTNQLFQYI